MRLLWILLIALLGIGTGYLVTRFESSAPVIRTLETPAFVSNDYTHEFHISDEGTGVEAFRVWIETGDQQHELINETYPGNAFVGAQTRVERATEVQVNPAELGLGEGPVQLHAWARDYSWSGNTTEVVVELTVDTRAPRIGLATGLTYVRRGGSEAVVYGLQEKVKRHGVMVGEQFFPGFQHPADPSRFLALYAMAPDIDPGVRPRVVAVDLAGNESSVGMTVELIERQFPDDTIRLSNSFMERKVAEILGSTNGSSALEGYLKLNRDLRAENAAKIREVTAKSSGDRVWAGPFLQLPNSHVGARFAEHRTYKLDGKAVDEQTHLGYDLASTSRAPIPAANDGVVAFAEELGIYGNTVILDHGLGLFTLYGHLSEIGVEKGTAVSRGEALGKTGVTGLAGGDHLHYAVIVSGVFVDPLEWFDKRWIEEHIEPKMRPEESN